MLQVGHITQRLWINHWILQNLSYQWSLIKTCWWWAGGQRPFRNEWGDKLDNEYRELFQDAFKERKASALNSSCRGCGSRDDFSLRWEIDHLSNSEHKIVVREKKKKTWWCGDIKEENSRNVLEWKGSAGIQDTNRGFSIFWSKASSTVGMRKR